MGNVGIQLLDMRLNLIHLMYEIITCGLQGIGFSNHSGQLSLCGSPMILLNWYQNFHLVSQLQMSRVGGDPNIAMFAWGQSKGQCIASLHECQGYRAWWDVRIQLQGIGLESHIGTCDSSVSFIRLWTIQL